MTPDSLPVTDPRTAHNRATYDRIAERYAANVAAVRTPATYYVDELRVRVRDGLADGAVLADLGCGPGLDAAWFADQGLTVVGLDLSAGMADIAARQLGPRVAQADLRRLPLASGSLAGLWCAAALLHVPAVDTATVLGELRRVLRPGGLLGLVTALGEGDRSEPVPYAPDESRWFVYRDPDVLAATVRAAGFDVRDRGEVEGNRRWGWYLAAAD